MNWVFDSLVAWILEKLASLFNVISSGLFSFFNMDRSVFDAFFTFFNYTRDGGMSITLYEVFKGLGWAICVLIFLLHLTGNLFSVVTEEYEDPLKLAMRSVFAVILVGVSGTIVDLEFNFLKTPYSSLRTLFVIESNSYGDDIWGMWGDLRTTLTSGFDASITDTVVMDILIIGLLFAIFWGFLKLSLEVAERYVIICLSVYLSPLAFSTAASKSSSKVFHAYLRMVFCQLILMFFNVVFVNGTILAIYKYIENQGTYTPPNSTARDMPTFIFCLLLLAFIKTGQKMDEHMRALGLDTLQTGGLVDEIRGGLRSAMKLGRGIVGAASAGGKAGGAVLSTVAGRGKASGGISGKISDMAKSGWAKVNDSLANSSNSKLSKFGGAAARSQIKSGAFNGKSGDENKGIQKACETAIGANNMSRMGIDPTTLVGENGQLEFKAANGAAGTLSFDKKEGNGWKQLKDENGNAINAWVKGSDNLGVAQSTAGTRQSISDSLGAGSDAALGELIKNNPSLASDGSALETLSLGNGEFSVISQNENGEAISLGRVVPASVGENIAGSSAIENDFGGSTSFIPMVDAADVLSGSSTNDGYIQLSEGRAADCDEVYASLANAMVENNIASGTEMTSFTSDGETYTAEFADPISGTTSISGNTQEILDNIGSDGIFTPAENDVAWVGASDIFDVNAYTAQTGEVPLSMELGEYNNFIITNESGSRYELHQAATTGDFNRVVNGSGKFSGVPFSFRRMSRD